jgi:hypothetical protein
MATKATVRVSKAKGTQSDGKTPIGGCRWGKAKGKKVIKCTPAVAKRLKGSTKRKARKGKKRTKNGLGQSCSCPSLSGAREQLAGHKDSPKLAPGAQVQMGSNGVCMVDVVGGKKMKGGLAGVTTKRFLRRDCN